MSELKTVKYLIPAEIFPEYEPFDLEVLADLFRRASSRLAVLAHAKRRGSPITDQAVGELHASLIDLHEWIGAMCWLNDDPSPSLPFLSEQLLNSQFSILNSQREGVSACRQT